MIKSDKLRKARKDKNDEFYTQLEDIDKEINAYIEFNPEIFANKTILCPCNDGFESNFTKYFTQNFKKLKLKKLICVSYANKSKNKNFNYKITELEINSEQYNSLKTETQGKILIINKEDNNSEKIEINNIKWDYLEGDGDFRSEEVIRLRDESDFIITNPPFSLFREFIAWIIEAKKQFLVIGSINCIAYKQIFPLLMENKVWLGTGIGRWISGFIVPNEYELYGTETKINEKGEKIVANNGCLWLTNIEHGKRHQPLSLMTESANIKFSKHKEIREQGYKKYDNYDAIDVPYTDAIPSDYSGYMGVPLTFMSKYCPEQFKIITFRKGNNGKDLSINGKSKYFRIIIGGK